MKLLQRYLSPNQKIYSSRPLDHNFFTEVDFLFHPLPGNKF